MFKKGFTLIELLVVIAIIAILAAILFPVFAQARDKARQSACLSNVKQIATAIQLYTDDYDETYPVTSEQDCECVPEGWGAMTNKNAHSVKVLLQPYCRNLDLFVCPNASRARQYDNDYGYCSYAWNGGVMDATHGTPAMAALNNPSSIILSIEMSAADQWNRMMPYWHNHGHWWCGVAINSVVPIHAGKTLSNMAFADGHAKGVKEGLIQTSDFGFYQTSDGQSRQWNLNKNMSDCSFRG